MFADEVVFPHTIGLAGELDVGQIHGPAFLNSLSGAKGLYYRRNPEEKRHDNERRR
jgi:hypothetical protein